MCLRAAGNVLGSSLRMKRLVPSTYCSMYCGQFRGLMSKLNIFWSTGLSWPANQMTLLLQKRHSWVVKNSRQATALDSFCCTLIILQNKDVHQWKIPKKGMLLGYLHWLLACETGHSVEDECRGEVERQNAEVVDHSVWLEGTVRIPNDVTVGVRSEVLVTKPLNVTPQYWVQCACNHTKYYVSTCLEKNGQTKDLEFLLIVMLAGWGIQKTQSKHKNRTLSNHELFLYIV